MVLVVEVVWEDSPASVLKVVSVALVFVVVTPASVVTEVSVLRDTLVLPLKDTIACPSKDYYAASSKISGCSLGLTRN